MMRMALVLTAAVSACQADETVSAYGPPGVTWQLNAMDGTPFTPRAQLTFSEGGVIAGHAACNRFTTASTVPYPWFAVGPIASTKMACPDLEAEAAFLTGLSEMTRAIFQDGILTMANDDGGEMVFTPIE